jgi:hypothetical protein
MRVLAGDHLLSGHRAILVQRRSGQSRLGRPLFEATENCSPWRRLKADRARGDSSGVEIGFTLDPLSF